MPGTAPRTLFPVFVLALLSALVSSGQLLWMLFRVDASAEDVSPPAPTFAVAYGSAAVVGAWVAVGFWLRGRIRGFVLTATAVAALHAFAAMLFESRIVVAGISVWARSDQRVAEFFASRAPLLVWNAIVLAGAAYVLAGLCKRWIAVRTPREFTRGTPGD